MVSIKAGNISDLRAVTIEQIQPAALASFFDRCFGQKRQLVRAVYSLRKAPSACRQYSLVMVDDDKIIAAIEYWPIRLPDHRPARLLGPLGVDKQWRGRGLSRRLLRESLGLILKEAKVAGVLVSGQKEIYQPFGFSRRLTAGLTLPEPTPPNQFMAKNICPNPPINWQSGKVRPDRA